MQAITLTNIQNQEKPNLKTLKRVLRAKYPQSKFQTVYLSKRPFNGEYTVYYASKGINMSFSAFCEHFNIDPNTIDTENAPISDSLMDTPKSVNQFKNNILFDFGELPKSSLLYKKIISDYALKCSIPIDYAQTLIRPVEWVRYVQDTAKKIYKPAYLIGSHFFTPDSKNSIGESCTKKMPIYTVDNYLYPLFHLKNEKQDAQWLEGKQHFVLLEGQNDVNCFNYHFKDSIYFGVTVGGVQHWTNAHVQIAALKALIPTAKFFTLFDNDAAGVGTVLPFAAPLRWTDIFHVPLNKGFDVCDAFQRFPQAKAAILSQLNEHSIHQKTETHLSGSLGTYLSQVLAENNIPLDTDSFKNTIVVSQTGSGKGYIMEKICQKGYNICVFPVDNLVGQMTKRIQNTGCKVFSYYGEHPNLENLGDNSTITTTVASFPKLVRKLIEKYGESFLKNINILWDEHHHFTISAAPGFMLKQLTQCIELLPLFGSYTGFTGTHIPNSHPFLAGMSILNVNIPILAPKIDIQICNDTILATATQIRELVQKGEKFAVLLNDKSTKLDKLTSSLKGLNFATLNSDTKKSAHFQAIINNDRLPDDLDGLITTSVLREGTNILNEINHIYVDSKKFSLSEIWQFINRFRTSIKAGTLVVHIMCSKFEEPDYTVAAFDFAKELAKYRKDLQNIVDVIHNCQSAEAKYQQLEGYKIYEKNPIYYNHIDNLLEINDLYVSNTIFNNETKHTYSSAATFEAVATKIGFEFTGISESNHNFKKEKIVEIALDVHLAKELRQTEYEKILEDLKKIQAEEKQEDFSGFTVLEHIERMKKIRTLTPVEKIVYDGLYRLLPYYDKSENLIADVETMVKKPKKRLFSLLKRRLRARAALKSELMETKCEVTTVIQSIIANIICGEIYISSELKEIVLSAMSGLKSFQHIAKKIKNAKRIDTVLKILEAFFSIKIGKSDKELRYKFSSIAFYSDSDKKPKDLKEAVFDLF
jgi:hypothetical protein